MSRENSLVPVCPLNFHIWLTLFWTFELYWPQMHLSVSLWFLSGTRVDPRYLGQRTSSPLTSRCFIKHPKEKPTTGSHDLLPPPTTHTYSITGCGCGNTMVETWRRINGVRRGRGQKQSWKTITLLQHRQRNSKVSYELETRLATWVWVVLWGFF